MAVIDGHTIVPLRDAKEAAQQQASEDMAIALAKSYPDITVDHMSLNADLKTSWQNGNVYYVVTLRPASESQSDKSAEKGDGQKARADAKDGKSPGKHVATIAKLRKAFEGHSFTLLLEDVPFELLRENLQFTYLADEKGEVAAYQAKGSVAMSRDMYKKIDSWNINWRKRL